LPIDFYTCCLHCLLQRLRSFSPDAVMALGLPLSPSVAGDSCGCLLSHALGAPLIDMLTSVWDGPRNIPQVSLLAFVAFANATAPPSNSSKQFCDVGILCSFGVAHPYLQLSQMQLC
jgi:hypothetical protein